MLSTFDNGNVSMLSADLKAAYNGTRWAIALRGLFALLIGTILLTRPIASVAALALVVALWAFTESTPAIIDAMERRLGT
jgi:uncharacterized membrane protein HdeD (DUF308 family)